MALGVLRSHKPVTRRRGLGAQARALRAANLSCDAARMSLIVRWQWFDRPVGTHWRWETPARGRVNARSLEYHAVRGGVSLIAEALSEHAGGVISCTRDYPLINARQSS